MQNILCEKPVDTVRANALKFIASCPSWEGCADFVLFRCSAVVAQVTVNHLVVGSNPTTGAIFPIHRTRGNTGSFFFRLGCSCGHKKKASHLGRPSGV